MKIHSFYTENPKEGKKFIALFDDGSGADLFYRCNEGDIISQDWFLDSGYCSFVYLPDNYKLFFEDDKNTKL